MDKEASRSTDGRHNAPTAEHNTPPSGDRVSSSIVHDIATQIYANSPSGLIASVVLTSLLVATHWSVIAHSVLLAWWSGMALLIITRAFLISRFKTAGASTSPGTWLTRHLAVLMLSGIGWGSAGILLFTPNSVEHLTFLCLVLAGMVAGAAAVYAASRRTFLAFALPTCLPIIAQFLLMENPMRWAMGITGLLFLGIMTGLVWTINSSLRRSFQLHAERTQAETQLIDLFEHTHDLIQSVAPDGRLLFVNRAWRDTLGYSSADIESMNIFDILHPDGHDHCRLFMQRILAGEDAGLVEITLQTKSGHSVVAEGQVTLHSEHNRPLATRGIFRDITARKLAELQLRAVNQNLEHLVAERTDKLRESEALHRNLVATVPGAVYEFQIDASGRRTFPFMSQGITKLMGLSPDECMANADAAFQRIHPEALPALEASIHRSHENLTPWLHEFPATTLSGETKWLHGHSIPNRDANGTTRWQGVLVDITERKQVEKALRASEERFRAAYYNAAIGMSICDLNGQLQEVNEALCHTLGYSKEELLAKDFQSLTHPKDLAGNMDRVRRLLAGLDTHQVFEKRYLRKDGNIVWAQVGISVIRDHNNAPSHLLAMVQDITERKQAESRLRTTQHAIDQALDYIFVIGNDGYFLDVNESACRRLGYSKQELLTKSVLDIDPDFSPAAWKTFWTAFTQQKQLRIETRHRSKSGEIYPVEVVANYIEHEGKELDYAFVRDITERKRAEEALHFLSTSIAHLNGEAFFSEMAVKIGQLLMVDIGFVGKLLATQPPRVCTVGLAIDGQIQPPVEYDLADTPCERVIGKQTAIFPNDVQRLFPQDQMLADLEIEGYAAIPLFDTNGHPIGHVGVMSRRPLQNTKQMEDILRLFAVRAAAELERQRTETKFHDLFEFSPDAVIMVNQQGLITLANRQAETLFGYSREELTNLPVEQLMPESGRHAHIGLRERFLATSSPRMMGGGRPDLQAQRKDGTTIPVDIGLSPINTEDGRMVVATIRDITARTQSERALRESNERFRILFEQAAVGVAQIETATGRFVRINQKYCEIVGYSQTEMLASDFKQLTHPDDLAADLDNMKRLIAAEIREFTIEKRYYRKDGAVVWVKLVVSPMWQPGATPDYHIAVVQDITERKQAEAALKDSQDQIRQMQKMEALGQLAGGVAHDFNNILTAILGNAEIAVLKSEAEHPARPNLARIIEAGQRASHVVQQILTFTRREDVSRSVLTLAPIVQEALTLLRATLPTGIELTSTCDASTPHVLANATQLHQVLMNLCTNAWHALGNQPGRITVTLAPVTLSEPLHSLHATVPPGHYVRLSVRDTGCGMSPETLTRIFDPFFTTKPLGQGTGLGLSVVHGIMEGHHGAVLVESAPGQGTAFHLYFPAVAPPVPASLPPTPPKAVMPQRPCHVLYLDDEEMLVELVRALFEPLGYRITGCTKPAEALALVRANPNEFDAVVTDYNMPELSGLDVARELAQIRSTLPVVLVSGYLTSEGQAAALAAQVKEIIYKPTMLQELGTVLTRLLDRHPTA